MDYDEVLKELGGFGYFQVMLLIGILLFNLEINLEFFASNMLIQHFSNFTCMTPNETYNPNYPHIVNVSADQCQYTITVMNRSVPTSSKMYPCQMFTYDTTVFAQTFVMEFNLICDKIYYPQHLSVIYQVGALLATLCTHISDKIGRQKTIYFFVIWTIFVQFTGIFSKHLAVQFIVRFLQGCAMGAVPTCMIYLSETMPSTYREKAISLFWVSSSLGTMIVPLISYYERRWRKIMLYVAIFNVGLIVTVVIIPESPRWLLTRNKRKEAIHAFKYISKLNRVKLRDNIFDDVVTCTEEPVTNIKEIFKKTNLMIKTVVIIFIYWTYGSTWAGFVYDISIASSNIFLNIFLLSLIEIPASLVAGYMTEKAGRKLSFIICFGITTSVIIILPFLGNLEWQKILRILTALTAKLTLTACGTVCDIIRAEIFPTSLRGTGFAITEGFYLLGMITNRYVSMIPVSFVPPIVNCIQNVIALLLLILFLPETQGMNLVDTAEEADQIYVKNMKEAFACYVETSNSIELKTVTQLEMAEFILDSINKEEKILTDNTTSQIIYDQAC